MSLNINSKINFYVTCGLSIGSWLTTESDPNQLCVFKCKGYQEILSTVFTQRTKTEPEAGECIAFVNPVVWKILLIWVEAATSLANRFTA